MPGRTRYPVIIFSLLFFLLLQAKPASAQLPALDKKVSFTFSDIPLSNVLRTISTKVGVKFSYNPELIQPGRRITMRFNNSTLREVLTQVLNDPSISIREIGNQIVLYRGDPSQIPLEPNQHIIAGKPTIVIPPKKIPDTVYVYRLDTLVINQTDTILRMVTLTRYDTVRISDTIFIENNKSVPATGSDINQVDGSDSLRSLKYAGNKGFYTALYFEMSGGEAAYKSISSGTDDYFTLMKNADAGPLLKFSTGLSVGYDFHSFGIRSGFGYSRLGEKFAYDFNIESGGFYKTDTIEKYYTLTGIDTTWVFITDSSWIPKVTENHAYRNANSYTYLDVPLLVKIRFWQNQKAEIYALGGVNASFLVSVNALHINPADKNEVTVTTKNDLNEVLFSWQAGVGAAMKLGPRSGISAETFYRSQKTNQYKDIPLDKRYGLFGLKLAAFVKF
jgi:hypothetical protein